jgi:hypothetical protein
MEVSATPAALSFRRSLLGNPVCGIDSFLELQASVEWLDSDAFVSVSHMIGEDVPATAELFALGSQFLQRFIEKSHRKSYLLD